MISEHFTPALSNDTKCEVCGCVIGHLESLQLKDLDYSVCQSFECRRIMSQKPFMTPLLFQSHLQIQTKIYNERSEKEAARKSK